MSEIFQNLVRNFFPKNFRCVFTFSKYDHQATNKKNLLAHEKRTVRTYAHCTSRYFAIIRPKIWNFYFPVYKKAEEGFRRLKTPLQPLSLTPSTKKFRFPSYLRYSQREYLNYLIVRYSLFVFSVFKICGRIIAKYPNAHDRHAMPHIARALCICIPLSLSLGYL